MRHTYVMCYDCEQKQSIVVEICLVSSEYQIYSNCLVALGHFEAYSLEFQLDSNAFYVNELNKNVNG